MSANQTMFGEILQHIGVIRRSGRYPWGSGDNPGQGYRDFLMSVKQMQDKGLSEADIAKGVDISVAELRAYKAVAKNAQKKADEAEALMLREKGMSNMAIGVRMDKNESSIRALLDPASRAKTDILLATADALRKEVDAKGALDVGLGVEHHIGVSRTKLDTAIAVLKNEGYNLDRVKVPNQGVAGKFTEIKVLSTPETKYGDLVRDNSKIKSIAAYSDDGGRTFLGIAPPKAIDPSRIAIRYAEDGGTKSDGLIYVRPGVEDVSLGGSTYAQVRIKVGDAHYLKGMAFYKADLPPGVDLMFNTNKSNTGDKLSAMKSLTEDPDNPFGAVISRQIGVLDGKGNLKPTSVMNILNEEGNWDDWSRNLSAQMLSKQPIPLAQKQLNLTYEQRKQQFDEVNSLTNPTVKKKLLLSMSDDLDSAAVHLKAAALPRQRTQVILPFPTIKDTEVYAPNFKNGEQVTLVRYPHGGPFEMPVLTVNNRNREAKAALGEAKNIDAIGINAKTASRLSGADFDGDTVLVIPYSKGIRTKPPLDALKDFDPQTSYPGYAGMKTMTPGHKQKQMGDVSNLITDMTIRGATDSEIARAVKHSMVVIDAEKHKLNYKLSAQDNGIKQLKDKYQKYEGKEDAGAATLISRASSQVRVPDRKARLAKDGGPIDKETGKRVFVETGASYTQTKVLKDGSLRSEVVSKTTKSKKLAEVDDAFTLSSGTAIEAVYANHSNRLKALANTARKQALETPNLKYSPEAKVKYKTEVDSLNAKLNRALKNKPLERQAQVVAKAIVDAKKQATPDMDGADLKKIKGQALEEARRRMNLTKYRVDITPKEWEAVQAGAISNNRLSAIIDNADLDAVKKLALPREATVMTKSTVSRAKSMLALGYTPAEVAEQLGVAASTLTSGLKREG